MMKPTLLALAATLAITAGTFGVTTGTASAQPYHGGPGYNGGWHDGPRGPGWHHPRKICKPIFRKIKVHGPYGFRWKTVAVGERCFVAPPRHW
ncbi:hypothetical protein C3941_24105 [Kaistia algarum]|uniref:hypothetical protein n=1 Tax=Kaistia algarum TaxID=2083279 RepID=UPI000CE724EB|nr:hypothetical protein [Kaistia algarum]MCX5514233.1 hypothetical protein [Kaistia algarum]PPE77378.1 hypothetical protein C3941_24105 [Kaistia algarum]